MCMGNHMSPGVHVAEGSTISPNSRWVKWGKGSTVQVEMSLMWLPLVSAQKDRSGRRGEQGVCRYSLASAPHKTRQCE